jgi:hypothetical protein
MGWSVAAGGHMCEKSQALEAPLLHRSSAAAGRLWSVNAGKFAKYLLYRLFALQSVRVCGQ